MDELADVVHAVRTHSAAAANVSVEPKRKWPNQDFHFC
jgi:hypothetical protein